MDLTNQSIACTIKRYQLTGKVTTMSNLENTVLLEFAYETAEYLTNHPSGIDQHLLDVIAKGDLDDVRELLGQIERDLCHADADDAREHFYGYNLLGSS